MLKIYKLYAGLTGEFEIFRTDAPESVVIEYAGKYVRGTLPGNDPDLFWEQTGYSVKFLACQDDDDIKDIIPVDCEIDLYDYFDQLID